MIEKEISNLIPGLLTEEIRTYHKVSFDADEVLIDSGTPVVNEFNKRFQTSHKRKEIDNWNSIKDWAIQNGLLEKDAEDLNFKLWTDPDILSIALPMPGSLDIYRYLLKEIHEIPIITVRNHKLREVTVGWFKKYLPEVPENWIKIRGPNEEKGNEFKIQKIKDNNIDWHFDDSLEISLMTVKNTTSNVFYIASKSTLDVISNHKRIKVIPDWEWSPTLC